VPAVFGRTLALTLSFSATALAQEHPNSVQADLGSGVLGVAYERTLVPALSARLSLALNRPWYTQILGGDESDVRGFGAELRPFLFPMGTAPEGLYVSPFARIVAIRAQDDLPEPVTGVGWTAGATAGYGFLLARDRLLLRFGAGAQYWAFEIEDDTGTAGLDGVYPDVDIIVGYTF
jgi:hypothetical protein